MISKMNKRSRNLLAVAGVIGMVFGTMLSIPSTLQANYLIASFSAVLIIIGIVLLAIALGD